VGPIELRIELKSWAEAQPLAAPIRYAVFLEEKDPPPGIELDELDPRCTHAVATDASGKAVGTGRLHPDGQIGRLVVLKEWRRLGVGEAILAALIDEARKRRYPEVTVSAGLQAAEFYRGHGFVADGKVFKEGSTLQQKMRKPLP
jgi:predicted GNAT family N-acyltransferase